MKECNSCKINKEFDQFYKQKKSKDGLDYMCKACKYLINKKYTRDNSQEAKDRNNARQKIYYSKNKNKCLQSIKVCRDKNKEGYKEMRKEYYLNNKDKIVEYQLANKDAIRHYRVDRYKNDPLFRLSSTIRKRINVVFSNNQLCKNNKTEAILGCSFSEFVVYLESKFEPWMTWENRGLYNGQFNYGWDIDHIIPLSSAKTEEEIYLLVHYSNLQPLCSKVNRDIKKDNLDFQHDKLMLENKI